MNIKLINYLEKYLRLGNIIYYLSYFIKKTDYDKIKFNTNNPHAHYLEELFENVKVNYFPEIKKSIYPNYNKLFNSSNIGFEWLKKNLNNKYLNTLQYNFDISDIAVIHIRLGDYIHLNRTKSNCAFKIMQTNWLEQVLQNYKEEYKNKNVVILSENIDIVKRIYMRIIKKYILEDKIFFTYKTDTPIYDLNLLINAKFIIGSCSTYSFIGCILNKNNAKMVVDYPCFLSENNCPLMYNHPNIIKFTI